ncbi:MAG: hypothetical protein ACI8V5_004743, partial [Limisphaerales bacterium]
MSGLHRIKNSNLIIWKKLGSESSLIYTPRQDNMAGRIKDFELFADNDPASWGRQSRRATCPTPAARNRSFPIASMRAICIWSRSPPRATVRRP